MIRMYAPTNDADTRTQTDMDITGYVGERKIKNRFQVSKLVESTCEEEEKE